MHKNQGLRQKGVQDAAHFLKNISLRIHLIFYKHFMGYMPVGCQFSMSDLKPVKIPSLPTPFPSHTYILWEVFLISAVVLSFCRDVYSLIRR